MTRPPIRRPTHAEGNDAILREMMSMKVIILDRVEGIADEVGELRNSLMQQGFDIAKLGREYNHLTSALNQIEMQVAEVRAKVEVDGDKTREGQGNLIAGVAGAAAMGSAEGASKAMETQNKRIETLTLVGLATVFGLLVTTGKYIIGGVMALFGASDPGVSP